MNTKNNNSVVAIDGSKLELNARDTALTTHRGYQDDDQFDEINISDLINVLKRHKLLIFTITSLIFGLALLYTLSIVPTYRAEATIKIDREADKVVSYDVYEQKAIDQNFYQTQYDVLKSRALATRVIEELGLEDHFNQPQLKKPFVAEQMDEMKLFFNENVVGFFKEKAVELNLMGEESNSTKDELLDESGAESQLAERPVELKFLSHLTVSPSKKSNIVHIFYESTEPELATTIVNSLGENFIKMNLESRGDSTIYAKDFLNEQLAITRSKLQKSEVELVAYAKKKNIINTDDNQSIISSELQALSQAYTEARTKLIGAESEYRQKNKISGSIRLMDNKVIQTLKEKKADLETKYTELREVYKPAYPAMREIKNQINALNKQIRKEVAIINSGSSNELKGSYLAAKENAAKLKKQLTIKKAEIMALRDKTIGYSALKREVDTNRELYDGLLQRVKEVGVAGGIVTNNISFLDQAFVPFSKHKPNTTRNLAIGLLLGLMLGVGLSFLIENMDDTIKTVEDIESLTNLPVIGFFPFTKTKRGENPLLINEKPFSPVAEAFRSIAIDLEYSTEDGIPKILHTTSSAANEGKSCTSINLATVLAQEGKNVVIIDADLRKPSLHEYLDMVNDRGVTDVLVGKVSLDDALQVSEVPGLTILSAGVIPSNPVKLLASKSMMDLLDSLSDRFDQVVIDSPPVLGMADSLILSNRAHGTVFVAASEDSKKESISNALKRLNRSYGNVIGVILTKVKTGKGHYSSYDNYYSYGKSGEHGTEMEPVRQTG
ncbi:MAG: polysaccharide biosynthesis tyrosine autokinase [Thiotrichaceae bacterium]